MAFGVMDLLSHKAEIAKNDACRLLRHANGRLEAAQELRAVIAHSAEAYKVERLEGLRAQPRGRQYAAELLSPWHGLGDDQ